MKKIGQCSQSSANKSSKPVFTNRQSVVRHERLSLDGRSRIIIHAKIRPQKDRKRHSIKYNAITSRKKEQTQRTNDISSSNTQSLDSVSVSLDSQQQFNKHPIRRKQSRIWPNSIDSHGDLVDINRRMKKKLSSRWCLCLLACILATLLVATAVAAALIAAFNKSQTTSTVTTIATAAMTSTIALPITTTISITLILNTTFSTVITTTATSVTVIATTLTTTTTSIPTTSTTTTTVDTTGTLTTITTNLITTTTIVDTTTNLITTTTAVDTTTTMDITTATVDTTTIITTTTTTTIITTTTVDTTTTTATTTTSTVSTTTTSASTTTTSTSCSIPTAPVMQYTSSISPYKSVNYTFTAVYTGTAVLEFGFRTNGANKYGYLDDVSIVNRNASNSEMLINGNFESGSLNGWQVICNSSCPSTSGTISNSGCRSSTYCYIDECKNGIEFLQQGFSITAGYTYTLSFWVTLTNNKDLYISIK